MDVQNSAAVPPCAGLCKAHGIDRRTFVSAATLAAAVALLESCGITSPNGGGNASGGAITVHLSSFSALSAVGGMARVDGGSGSPTALVRTGTSTFVGLSMICTHQGSTIGIVSGGFICPNHGAQFNTNGSWVGGQPTSSLQSFSATYDSAAGTVVVNRPN